MGVLTLRRTTYAAIPIIAFLIGSTATFAFFGGGGISNSSYTVKGVVPAGGADLTGGGDTLKAAVDYGDADMAAGDTILPEWPGLPLFIVTTTSYSTTTLSTTTEDTFGQGGFGAIIIIAIVLVFGAIIYSGRRR